MNSIDGDAQIRLLKAQLRFKFDVRKVRKLPTIHHINKCYQHCLFQKLTTLIFTEDSWQFPHMSHINQKS